MSAHWNRAFAVLLGLSLTTAALSVVVVQQIESTFVSATDEVSRETASLRPDRGRAHPRERGRPPGARLRLADERRFPRRRRGHGHRLRRRSDDLRRGANGARVPRRGTCTVGIGIRRRFASSPPTTAAADAFAADTGPQGDIAHGELAQQTDAISCDRQVARPVLAQCPRGLPRRRPRHEVEAADPARRDLRPLRRRHHHVRPPDGPRTSCDRSGRSASRLTDSVPASSTTASSCTTTTRSASSPNAST